MMRLISRWLRRGVVLGICIVILLFTNIATLVSATIHDALWSAIRGVGSAVVEADWTRKPTQAELDMNRRQLSADLEGTRADLDGAQRRVDELGRTRNRLESNLNIAERRAGVLTDEASGLRRELRVAKVNLDNELTNSRRLANDLEGTLADLDGAQRRVDELGRTRNRLESNLNIAERRAGVLTDEASGLRRELRVAKVNLDNELTNSRRLTGQIGELQLNLKQVEPGLLIRSDETGRILAQGDAGLDELAALRRTTPDIPAERMQKASAVVDVMERRVTSSIRRNMGGEVAQMVPFLGTGVGLALIGWEVHDACTQLREVEELRRLVSGESLDSSDDPEVVEMCGLSRSELIARFSGEDLEFSRCMEARQATLKVDPPECAGYEMKLPDYDSTEDLPDAVIDLPIYD